jgi:hypothetical protein
MNELTGRFPASEDMGGSVADKNKELLQSLGYGHLADENELKKVELKKSVEKITPQEVEKAEEDTKKWAAKEGIVPLIKGVGKGAVVGTVEDIGNLFINVGNTAKNFLEENGIGDYDNWENLDFNLRPDDNAPFSEKAGFFVGRYLTPFVGTLKALQATGTAVSAAKAIGISSIYSASSVDKDDENLSTLIRSLPEAEGTIMDYLTAPLELTAIDKDDSEIERRFKTGLEAAIIDTSTLGLSKVVASAIKYHKTSKLTRMAKKAAETSEQLAKEAAPVEAKAAQAGVSDGGPTIGEQPPIGGTKADEGAQAGAGAGAKSDEGAKGAKGGEEPPLSEDQKKIQEKLKGYFGPPPEGLLEQADIKKFTTADELTEFFGNRDPKLNEKFEEMRRGTISLEEVTSKAEKIYKDRKKMDALLARDAGYNPTAEELVALKMAADAELQNLNRFLEMDMLADDADVAGFLNAMAKFRYTATSALGGASESGRALRFFQDVYTASSSAIKQAEMVDEYTKVLGKDAAAMHKLAKKALQEATPAQFMQRMKDTRMNKMSDVFYEMWFNGALSRLSTHSVNLMSNMSMTIVAPVEQTVAAGISKLDVMRGLSTKQTIRMNEAHSMVHGYHAALTDLFYGSKNTYKKSREAGKGVIESIDDMVESNPVLSVFLKEKLPLQGNVKFEDVRQRKIKSEGTSTMAGVVNGFGYLVNFPTRGLHASDVFFKLLNHRAFVHQRAARLANEFADNPSRWRDVYQKTIANPPSDISMAAHAYQERMTFTSQLNPMRLRDEAAEVTRMKHVMFGDGFEKIAGFMEQIPLGRAYAPFIRVGANLNSMALERLPLIQKISPRVAEQLSVGGAERAEALAKMAVGGAIMSVGAGMAAGGALTGLGRKDYKSDRTLQNPNAPRPTTIKVGNVSVDLGRYEPLSTPLILGATIAETISYFADEDSAAVQDMTLAASAMLVEMLTPNLISEDMPKFFGMIADLGAGKISHDQFEKAAQFLATAAPYSGFAREWGKGIVDPTRRDKRADPSGFFVKRFLERVQNEILDTYGFGGMFLQPELNIFGEEISPPTAVGPDHLSPFYVGIGKEDPVTTEMRRLGLHSQVFNPEPAEGEMHFRVSMPQRSIKSSIGGKVYTVRLSPEKYNKYVRLAAGIGDEFGGPTLKEALSTMIRMPVSDERKKLLIKDTISQYRSRATEYMKVQDEEIFTKFKKMAAARNAALQGPTASGVVSEDISGDDE